MDVLERLKSQHATRLITPAQRQALLQQQQLQQQQQQQESQGGGGGAAVSGHSGIDTSVFCNEIEFEVFIEVLYIYKTC